MKLRHTIFSLLLFSLFTTEVRSQHSSPENVNPHYETPKLVIGIMVDQMRYDYLYRYWDKYSDDGFKRLLNEGFSFDNTHFSYAPTFTGPGHASVYTGTTPSIHGIIENRWFSRDKGRTTYVTDDPDVQTVGSNTDEGKMSPQYLKTTTIGDELRLHTNMESKVIGVSLKDRGSILPAGHTGDAYWFDYEEGRIITSTYYHDELPDWVQQFNDRDLVTEYLSHPWESLLPLEEYTESAERNQQGAAFPGQESAGLPHNLPEITEEAGRGVVSETPYGDELVMEMARAAIEGEALGEGNVPDLLAISFSSPDHIGHRFGPASREVQDTYLRLDLLLAEFLNDLDEKYGIENVLVFLTSDHGAAHTPTYMKEKNIPAGYFSQSDAAQQLRDHLEGLYGIDPVLAFRRFQVYLDREFIEQEGLSLEEIQQETARFLPAVEGIKGAMTSREITTGDFDESFRNIVQRGYYPVRSGDVLYWLDPQWMGTRTSGTTHGAPYSYDTRAPMIWYGWDIPAGRTTEPVFITDISATLAIFLNTPYPNGNTGTPMNHFIRR